MIRRLSTTWSISFGLAMLTICVLLMADFIGLIPSASEAVLEGRKQLSELLAIQCTICAARNDLDAVQATMQLVVDRNEHVRSAILRATDGQILAQTDEYEESCPPKGGEGTTPNQAVIPIYAGSEKWGTMEITFDETGPGGLGGLSKNPIFALVLFVGLMGFTAYAMFLRRTLRYLDPNAVVPERVRTALNNLVEGVALFDKDERIVLANSAFARNTGRLESSLLGLKASELNWKLPASSQKPDVLPWSLASEQDKPVSAVPMVLSGGAEGGRKLMVNAAPIHDESGCQRGVLATFDDITEIEERNDELQEALHQLETSRDEIRRQNQQLAQLATTDALTGCLNRRALFDRMDTEFSLARRHNHELACVMVDIDHFKNINDRHGHSTGDEVLRAVAGILRSGVRSTDPVCRYGGEEFCLFLLHTDAVNGMQAAENLRHQIATTPVQGIQVTASFGVSCLTSENICLQRLIDQADKALYAAKDSGRNKVVCWNDTLSIGDHLNSASPELAEADSHSDDECHIRAGKTLTGEEALVTEVPAISDAAMLEIGLEVERLAFALDNRDRSWISVTSSHLTAIAAEHDMQQVAELADQIATASRKGDLVRAAHVMKELIQSCCLPEHHKLRTVELDW